MSNLTIKVDGDLVLSVAFHAGPRQLVFHVSTGADDKVPIEATAALALMRMYEMQDGITAGNSGSSGFQPRR